MRLLIVNADDFGLNAAANAGIIECHRAGSVTSTTLMANGSALDEAVRLAKEHPRLGVGLHFNLTWGQPIAAAETIRSLVDEQGRFVDRNRFARRMVLGRIKPEHVERELRAQIDHVRDLGIAVTHIDSHQHVHAFGPVFAAVAERCERERLPMRVPWAARDEGASLGRRLRRSVLAAMLSRSTGRWMGRVRWNDDQGSVFDLGVRGEALTAAHYRRVLSKTGAGIFELMVHPVTDAAAMTGYTRVGAVAEAEYLWLRLGALPALAEAMGFRLGNYRNVGE